MNEIYENALSAYQSKRETTEGNKAEKKSLLQKATNAIKSADSAMRAALSACDKNAYKKAMKQKQEAEGDERFYKDLLSQSDEIDEAEKFEANKTLALIQGEQSRIETEAEKVVYDKFLELYQLVLDYQLELKMLLCSENAYKIEVLKRDSSQYEAWNAGMQPSNFQQIFDVARAYGVFNGHIGKRIADMTNEAEAKRVSERSRWGWIGGKTPQDV